LPSVGHAGTVPGRGAVCHARGLSPAGAAGALRDSPAATGTRGIYRELGNLAGDPDMTPAARVQAAIGLLDSIIAAALARGAPADRILADWFKANRYAGSKDRRAVREL